MESYNPHHIFDYFKEISSIPRKSGQEEAISNHMVAFATTLGLESYQDDYKNVFIRKPGTLGYEDHPTVILQGHLDMVCTKLDSVTHNFLTDPIDLVIDGDILKANGTTLGADDGFSLAYCMAILASDSIAHPPLEVVFTVAEETSVLGAKMLDFSRLEGKVLLNLDGCEESCITIGSAGGESLSISLPVERQSIDADKTLRRIEITGLQGGHSGEDIHRGRGNAIKILGCLLERIAEQHRVEVVSIKGGSAPNAIPLYASVDLYMGLDSVPHIGVMVKEAMAYWNGQYESEQMTISMNVIKGENDTEELKELDLSEINEVQALTKESLAKVVTLIKGIPYGVLKANPDNSDEVYASNNPGVIECRDGEVYVQLCQRFTDKNDGAVLHKSLEELVQSLGATLRCDGAYPSWKPVYNTPLHKAMIEAHKAYYNGKEPNFVVIHAGLEAGYFVEHIEGMDAVNIGPTIYDLHSTSERMELSSFANTFNYLVEVLKRL